MRKVLYLLTILVAFGKVASAQTYYPVTHLTGNAVVNGTTVGVSTIGSPTSTADFCGPNTSPYYIGIGGTSGYAFTFTNPTNPVTHLRMYFSELHDQDSIIVTINGSPYAILASDMSAFAGTCGLSATQALTANGALTATNNQGNGRGGAQLDLQISPATINSLSVVNHSNGVGANGAVFALLIANDSCTQRFEATSTPPYCRTRNLELFSTGFPNTNYSWTTNVSSWTSNQQNPVFGPLSVGGAKFIVTATRGACVYKDSVEIFVDNIPTISGNTQLGPRCAGNNDTIITTAGGLAAGGTYNWIHPQTGAVYTSFDNFNPVDNIQTSDSGVWKVFAISLNGCYSDTVDFRLLVHEEAIAAFKVDSGAGCSTDTAFLTNLSAGATMFNWTFGDGNSSTATDPVHIYQNQGTYSITLIASNSNCADTTSKSVTIAHPLISSFTVDDDSICQGTLVTFNNNSTITPGTSNQTTWLWEYGTGDTSQRDNAFPYTYNNQGEYITKLIVTDYLGCSDTSSIVIVVDSAGFISYTSTDDSICVGQAITFNGTYNLQGNTGIKWTFGDGVIIDDSTSIRHVFENSGVYNVVFDATYRICPSVSQSIPMFIGAYPVVDLGDDTALCLNGEPVLLEERVNKNVGNAKYFWNTPNKDVTPSTYVRHPGVYAVTVEIDGCATTDSVEVKKNCYINIPNVFTPNNDGYNDYFLPRQLLSRNVTDFKMKIFNRWGEIVFETTSINGRGWDGKVNDEYQPTGVYIYLIEVTFGNNTNERYQGNVTLIR